jgi:AraC-like DNA-binding protein
MAKLSSPRNAREARDFSNVLKTAKGEALAYRQVFDALAQVIPLTEGLIISTLPRGTLQIAQPQRVPEPLLKSYAREFHALDRPTWQAIAKSRPIRARECWPPGEFESTRFYTDFIAANGFKYLMAAPLSAPVIDGYPGAVQLLRTAEQGAFNDADVQRFGAMAKELDEAIVRTRQAREDAGCPRADAVVHDAPYRQFIFDQDLNVQLPKSDPGLDPRLIENMTEHARFRFGHVDGKQIVSDRVSLPDARGDLWNFRVVVHRSYPALGEGPFVFFCLQPNCYAWSALRPADFQADSELARLIPAMKFMRDQFHRGPTLTEIAKTVHLSPFHFHRRFTELLGITPKHFLLDCQIEEAKTELLAREKDLVQIASDCGFAHQSHFTSRFKQATGLTPTRWRRMASEAQPASNN